MLHYQLKTLIWRNLVLKKRGKFATFMEIIIPTLIILIIAKTSKYKETSYTLQSIENIPLYSVHNSTRWSIPTIKNQYFIVFSKDFDAQKQNIFLDNFKKDQYFSSFKYIEPNLNFTEENDDYIGLETLYGEYEYMKNDDNVDNDNNNNDVYDDISFEKRAVNDTTVQKKTKNNKNKINNNTNPNSNNNTDDINNTDNINNTGNTSNANNIENTNNNLNSTSTDIINNPNDVNLNNTTNPNPIPEKKSSIQEFKIRIFNSEKDFMNTYKEETKRSNIRYDSLYDHPHTTSITNYGIIFKSLTDYTLYFDYGLELVEMLTSKSLHDFAELANAYNLQTITSNSLTKLLMNTNGNANALNKIPEIEFNYKIMDRREKTTSHNTSLILSFIPFFMLFYYVPCVCTLLNNLVIEKESKIKESLVIVGLKKSAFWISWAITYGIIIVVASSVATFIMAYLKVFSSIHWTIILFIIVIYGLACICIAFTLSTLINKSKTSNTIGAIIILSFFVFYFIYRSLDDGTVSKWICCVAFPQISVLSFFDYLISMEKQNLPITFLNMIDTPLLRNYVFAILGSLFLYFLLALYLDNVLPQGSNLHKKWYFFVTDPFRCCFSKKSRQNEMRRPTNNNNNNNLFIQKDPEGLQKAVEVSHIGRNFKLKGENIEILKDINFNAYYNEIFAILGHNGAGKTTLLRIMTGVLSSTRGDVYYDNVPIRGNETDVCKQFGYCPQFDTFSKNLTVAEHVKLFAGIKGVEVDVEKVLKDIDLLNKKNNFPKQLSGGQRRKLCISLALLGSPKYVFLDEPTTGLDPYSRKSIWELLSRKKEGCTMFVTTHYMDEADLLADRKMIISNGDITCLGTSIFLKNTFNMNYTLDVNLTNKNDSLRVDQVIDYYCPGFSKSKKITTSQFNRNDNTINTSFSGNNNGYSNNNLPSPKDQNNKMYIVTYLLPMKRSQYFKDIFSILNDLIHDNTNSITNFSLTAPTLEELFIKLEGNKQDHYSDGMNESIQKAKNMTGIAMNGYNDSEISNDYDDTNKLIGGLDPVFGKTNLNKSSALRQIWAIINIRIKIFVRNKTFALIYTLFPICLIIAAIYFENKLVDSIYDEEEVFKSLQIKPNLYEDVQWFKNPSASSGLALDIINRIETGNKLKLESIDYDKELTVASSKLTDDKEKNIIGGFAGTVNPTTNALEFTIYKNLNYNINIPIAINLISNAFLEQNNINQKITVSYNPLPRITSSSYDEDDQEHLFNTAPEQIKLMLEPLLSVAIAIAISLSISIFGPLTVKEREDGITWQLYLNGTSRINYWLGVFLSDTLCLFVPILLIIIAGCINDISIFNSKVIVYTIVITLLWIVCSLFHQYVVSHFFKRYDKCSNLFIILNPILTLFIGFYCLIVALVSSSIEEVMEKEGEGKGEQQGNKKVEFIFHAILILYAPATIVLFYSKLSTFIGLRRLKIDEASILKFTSSEVFKKIMNNKSLNSIERNKQIAKAFFNIKTPTLSEVLKSKDIKMNLILALILIVVYVLILVLKERVQTKFLKDNKGYTPEQKMAKDKKLSEGPIDVYNEFKRVRQSMNNNDNGMMNNRNSLVDNIALKVFRLNKDFYLSISEMNKRRKQKAKEDKIMNGYEEESDDTHGKKGKGKKNKKGKGGDKKESAFEKMDDRVTYDKDKKKYVNRIVDDVTFGVDNGQCLGLLGPNGAGKTTTISMMTGNISRTHGKVVYGTNDLSSTDLSDLSLGYCSQYDALWKLLTVKETIQFYLNICGYPRRDIPRYTKALIEACGIENHTNKKVNEISGGTKRKLSLIIAICSSPSYLILDEPSAGMDPFTRRYMWKLISQLKKVRETATILTTHSTEEAEALCDRIAILIKGRLVCIDTPSSIKMNQSHRYVLEVFTSNPERFEEFYVKKYNLFGLDFNAGEGYDLETSFNYQKYTVEMRTESIAQVFSFMEHAKENGFVSQYNFGQYSLEQVFIDFVNNAK